jgi:hypothetical protein
VEGQRRRHEALSEGCCSDAFWGECAMRATSRIHFTNRVMDQRSGWANCVTSASGRLPRDPVECPQSDGPFAAESGQERTCSLAPDCIVESAG